MNKQGRTWQGEFGNEYHERNPVRDQSEFWQEVVGGRHIRSALEFGAGKGDNLIALRKVLGPTCKNLVGIDVNPIACAAMRDENISVISGSALEVHIPFICDLVLTRGFLIHVPPSDLQRVFSRMYWASSAYICVAEYYAPARRSVFYQGKTSMLWADDYAGLLMQKFKDLKLVKYGFKYHAEGGDDLTYFLLQKGTQHG